MRAPRRSVAGPGVPRGARMNSRLRPADRAAPDYWLMPHRDVRRILPRLSLTLLLAWLVLYPILVAVADAAHGDALGTFVSRTGEWAALWASVWVSLASVVLAAAIGVPLALLFEWLDFPGRKTLGSLVALPAVLPPFVGVIAFLFLYGESGFVARAIQRLLGLDAPPWRLQGAGAILLVHAYSMYVYFYLFTRAGLAKLDASMLEAAQALGDAAARDPAAAAPLPRRGGAARLHDRPRLVQRAVRVRGRLPRDDDADRRLEAQRRTGARHRRDGRARPGRRRGARADPQHRGERCAGRSGEGHRAAASRAAPARRADSGGRGRLVVRVRVIAAAPHAAPRLPGSVRNLDNGDV